MTSEEIKVTRLKKAKPGPGGHWYDYEASRDGVVAHGQTEREARMELTKKENSK